MLSNGYFLGKEREEIEMIVSPGQSPNPFTIVIALKFGGTLTIEPGSSLSLTLLQIYIYIYLYFLSSFSTKCVARTQAIEYSQRILQYLRVSSFLQQQITIIAERIFVISEAVCASTRMNTKSESVLMMLKKSSIIMIMKLYDFVAYTNLVEQ